MIVISAVRLLKLFKIAYLFEHQFETVISLLEFESETSLHVPLKIHELQFGIRGCRSVAAPMALRA